MKITYVKDIDVLNIELKKGKFEHSEEVADDVILDLSPEGEILGIEIVNASKRLGKDASAKLTERYLVLSCNNPRKILRLRSE